MTLCGNRVDSSGKSICSIKRDSNIPAVWRGGYAKESHWPWMANTEKNCAELVECGFIIMYI